MKMRLLTITLVALLLFATQSQSTCADPVPCTCLQELWVDYPGPYDLYFSLDHMTSCDDAGEEGIWYGAPSNSSLPQICSNYECEAYGGEGQRIAATFPGHGQELVGAKAWDVFRVGLESATRKMPGLEFGAPTYHIIPRKNLPAQLKATRDMVVMAIPINVHVKGSRFDGNSYYLCVQMDSAIGLPITTATFEDGKLGIGSQLHVKYRVKSGEVRKGLVWLR
jgi:hypothetical protein